MCYTFVSQNVEVNILWLKWGVLLIVPKAIALQHEWMKKQKKYLINIVKSTISIKQKACGARF